MCKFTFLLPISSGIRDTWMPIQNKTTEYFVLPPPPTSPNSLLLCLCQVFYVMYGKLAVEIHRTTRLLESGDSFFVPPGKGFAYSFTNIFFVLDMATIMVFRIWKIHKLDSY